MSIASRIESIENHIGNAYSGLEDIGANLTNVNKNIDNIKSCLDNIYSELPKTSQEGTSITLANTRRGKMVIQPKGNTIQYSYSGKNLANIINISNQTSGNPKIIIENDTITIKDNLNQVGYTNTNTKLNELCPNLQIGDTVYLFYETTSTSPQKNIIYLSGYNNSWAKNASITITQEMLDSYVIFYGGYEETAIISNFMITKENNNTYEPYVGEIPSPNPDYPQEIKNVTGDNNVVIRGKNNLKIENTTRTINDVTFTVNDDKSITINGTASDRVVFPLNVNGTSLAQTVPLKSVTSYIISKISQQDVSNVIFQVYYDKNGETLYSTWGFTTAEKTNLGAYIIIQSGITIDNVTVSFQIEEGSTATTYEPYIEPIEKELKLSGKNNITGFYGRTTGFISYNFDNSNLTNTMTYSFIPTFTLNDIALYVRTKNSSGIYSKATFNTVANEKTSITFSLTDAELEILKSTPSIIQIYKPNSFDNSDNIAEIQLEEGSTATEYEPYYNYELCKIGDYQDKIIKKSDGWYKRAEIAKYVYDEKSNPLFLSSRTNTALFMYTRAGMVNVGNISALDLFCNQFINQAVYGNDREGIQHTQSDLYISINKSRLSTLDSEGLKTYMANNNIIVNYPLATPTETKITETPLINQLEDLYRTIIPGGTIIVETESEEENAQLIVNLSALERFENS